MRCVFIAGIVLAVAPQFIAAARGDDMKPRILIVADQADELPPLAEFLADIGYEVRRAGQKDPDLAVDRFRDFDAIFMYIHSRMHPPVERALIEYAQGGGRLLVLHHGLASAKMANPGWLKFLGVGLYPRSHPDHPWLVSGNVTHTMVRLVPDHFITTYKVRYDRKVEYRSPTQPEIRGTFDAFDLPDTEIFHNQRLTEKPGRVCLFGYRLAAEIKRDLPANIPAMEDTSLWYMPTGRGWTFYLQAGHTTRDFMNENFRQIIHNCLKWEPADAAEK